MAERRNEGMSNAGSVQDVSRKDTRSKVIKGKYITLRNCVYNNHYYPKSTVIESDKAIEHDSIRPLTEEDMARSENVPIYDPVGKALGQKKISDSLSGILR